MQVVTAYEQVSRYCQKLKHVQQRRPVARELFEIAVLQFSLVYCFQKPV